MYVNLLMKTNIYFFSLFGYFNENETVQSLYERTFYQEDYFGLKTLDRMGKLKLITVNGVQHFSWRKNISVIDTHIIPYLD